MYKKFKTSIGDDLHVEKLFYLQKQDKKKTKPIIIWTSPHEIFENTAHQQLNARVPP